MHAADQADDPLMLASAARAGTHALLAVGQFEDALNLGNTATDWLSSQVAENDPNALSLYGMLAAVSPNGRFVAIDLVTAIWVLPAGGARRGDSPMTCRT